MLTTAQREIPADRAGIAVLSADVVDAQGVHVFGANPPLTWTVTGPATLLSPSHYETDTKKNGAMDGTMYIDLPVASVLRSTATPGEIRVRLTAPGLAPAELTLRSVAPGDDRIAGLTEPALADAGRAAVQRNENFKTVTFAPKGRKLLELREDADFTAASPEDYHQQIEKFVRERNPDIDPFSAEYRAFVERVTAIVVERNGHLVADDYNFNVRALNEKKPVKKKK